MTTPLRKKLAAYQWLVGFVSIIAVAMCASAVYLYTMRQPTERTVYVHTISNAAASTATADPVLQRDVRGIVDPLYPAHSRLAADQTRALMAEPRLHPAPNGSDTYRLAGYLVSQEDRGDTWKLYARERHRGGQSEFYVQPANRNPAAGGDAAIKVALTSDNTAPRMRDLYTLPDEVSVQHPMFDSRPYSVVSLGPPNLSSGYW